MCTLNSKRPVIVYCVPLNHAKLSTGGAASLLQVRVTDPPSGTSPAGKTVMEVERGPSGGEESEEEKRKTYSMRKKRGQR